MAICQAILRKAPPITAKVGNALKDVCRPYIEKVLICIAPDQDYMRDALVLEH